MLSLSSDSLYFFGLRWALQPSLDLISELGTVSRSEIGRNSYFLQISFIGTERGRCQAFGAPLAYNP